MAGIMDSKQETFSCPVCFEKFTEHGVHVPRLLPCNHTMCDTCIGLCIHGNKIKCPVCLARHEAKREEESFPQNRHILEMIQLGAMLEGEEMKTRCPKHGEQDILEYEYQKASCPPKAHLESKKTSLVARLLEDIEITTAMLDSKIQHVEHSGQDAVRKAEITLLEVKKEKYEKIQRLEKIKEAIIRHYDEMIKQAKDKKAELKEAIENELIVMRDNGILVNIFKQSTKGIKNTLKKTDTMQDTVANAADLPRMKKYEYSEYVAGSKNPTEKEKFVFLVVDLHAGQLNTLISSSEEFLYGSSFPPHESFPYT